MSDSDAKRPAPAREGAIRNEGRETELKFVVDAKTFTAARVSAAFGAPAPGPRSRRLRSVYFDTGAGDLRRRAIALRVRRVRGRYVMGLKWATGAGAFERGETEVAIPAPEPDPSLFPEEVAAGLREILGDRPLRAIFTTDVYRQLFIADFEGARIEVAFDAGFVVAGERREPIREIELELKEGDFSALCRFALRRLDAFEMKLGVLSKAERGARMIAGEPPKAVRAWAPAIGPDTIVDDAVAVLLGDCLAQFTRNWPVAASGDATEAVHQMRVSMRRLRAALKFFHRAFPSPEFERFRAEARRIASAMGEARDWDVFVEMAQAGPLEHFPDAPGLAALLGHARANAGAGHAATAALIDEPATTRFVLELDEFAARRGWRDDAHPALLGEPVSDFAARVLDRLDRKARTLGRRLERLDVAQRHKLRIALKSLRYAADFFGHLFRPRADVRRFGRKAAELQDILGQLNDAALVSQMLARLEPEGAAPSHAAGLIAGWYGRGGVDDAALRAAWKSFRKADRYWRDRLGKE